MKRFKVFILVLFGFIFWAIAAHAAQGLTEDYGPVVEAIVERGDKALDAYSPSSGVLTGNEFSRLYFDIFESSGMEFTLNLKDSAFMLKIESSFSLIISQCMKAEEKQVIEKSWKNLKINLDIAVEEYSSGGKATGFWGRVLQSFLILFREGVEAMLVVAALIAYLRRSGYPDKVKVIWLGVVAALFASAGAAWALNSLLKISGAGREAIEGVTMLIAVAVLLYVSFWLTAKSDADRWKAFIQDQMDDALGKGSMFALGFAAFLSVFREGAETILFYQALIGGITGSLNAVWVGMAIAVVCLLLVYGGVKFASLTLPIGIFFKGTAVLLFTMAFIFTGKGILELQVSGMIHTTGLDGWPMVAWLGVFPIVETMIAQALVLCIIPIGWGIMRFKRQKIVIPA